MTTDFAAALRPGPDAIDLTNDFSGRTAVVTGGASGIGNAIAGPWPRGVPASPSSTSVPTAPRRRRPTCPCLPRRRLTTGPDAAADGADAARASMPASPAT